MISALAAGVRFFQYRYKNGSRRAIYETALQLASRARQSGALFIVNDYADIAAAAEADGVHLGQDDLSLEHARKLLGSKKLIGISTHSREEALAAQAGGADYIGFGSIFPTATKDTTVLQGCARLSEIKQAVSIPIVAIGGINHGNVGDVIMAGADGVAVISAILNAPDIKQAAEAMMTLIRKAGRRRG